MLCCEKIIVVPKLSSLYNNIKSVKMFIYVINEGDDRMEIQEIGRMICKLRISKGISQEELCRGICSVATLSRLEAGERRPDILVFNALFQRVGKSTDHINILMTLEEFEYFVKRRNIEISMITKNFRQAVEDIKILENELKKKSQSLQRQDIYRLHALLHIQKENNMTEAEKYVHKAILETISDFDTWKKVSQPSITHLWFSESEIQLILLYIYIKEYLGDNEVSLLESVIDYIRSKITDEKFQNKELSMALYLQACFYKKELLWEECYECCETAIAAEVKNGTISILFQCLELEMECFENRFVSKNAKLRKKEYESLKAVLEEYGDGISGIDFLSFWETSSQEKSLIDEVIRFSRLRGGYSQEELSEGICTPETLSRVETGKQNPTIKNFYALMKKTGVNMGYYNTEFAVKKFETLEKVNKLKRLTILKKFKEAERLIKEIQKEIDMNIVINRQQIGLYHTVCDYRLDRIKIEEALKQIEEILELTLKKMDGEIALPYQPTPIEIALLNQVAVYYRNMGEQKQAVEILIPIYEYFHQSKLEAPQFSQKYFMIIGNLSSYFEELDELERAKELLDESLTAGVKYNVGLRIGSNLIAKAYIQEREGANSCLKNYERGYYLCGLFEDFINQNNVKKHMLENGRIIYKN